MQFKDVLDQDRTKQDLLQSIHNASFPHATLILGKKGWGGLPLGLALAQYLMCDNRTETDSCGQCTNCLMAGKYAHPDISYSFPTVKPANKTDNLSEYYLEEFKEFASQTPYGSLYSWLQYINAENSQGNISVDQCRVIIEFFNLKAYQGAKKIHVIWMPEYLGKEGNVLLKLIEEPPKDSYLILVSENEHSILGTIRSRLQKFELRPLPLTLVKEVLISRYGQSEEQASFISHLAQGDFSKATELSQSMDSETTSNIIEVLQYIYKNDGVGIIKWVDDISKMGRETIKSTLLYFLELYDKWIRVHFQVITLDQLPEEEKKVITLFQTIPFNIHSIEKIKKGIQDTQYNISRNAHIKSQLLNFCVSMQYWIKNRTLTV